eukprot:g12936.t1
MFGGLEDGVAEPIPALIDEDLDLESLFAGGEDLFEFLDEREPAPLVIPPTPVVDAAPVVAPTPTVERREPSGYTAPVFFPFGKPEPTAPQLKLSGVSSFKKINSRLLQGGELTDKEEADAIRELERALGVLGHQKRFLIEHKAGLEKWTSAVYGFKLSTEGFDATALSTTAMGDRETRDGRGVVGAGGASLREMRVTVKCKGAKRRVDKQPLLAHVDRMWSPRQGRLKNVKKRSSVKAAEKPAKRGKLALAKVDQALEAGTTSTAVTKEAVDEQSDGGPDAPDHGVNGLERCSSLPLVSKRQSLPEDFSLESEDRLGGSALTPSGPAGPAAKAFAEPGLGCERLEDDADVLRQRLVQALVVPSVAKGGQRSDKQPAPPHPEMAWKMSSTNELHLLEVAQLSLAQRVVVQLNSVGIFAVGGKAAPTSGGQATGAAGEEREGTEKISGVTRVDHERGR